MDVHESLSHTKLDCIHVVFIPSAEEEPSTSSYAGILARYFGVWRNKRREDTKFCRSTFLGSGVLRVSTVGRDEQMIREYIRNQEKEDQRLYQLNFRR